MIYDDAEWDEDEEVVEREEIEDPLAEVDRENRRALTFN
jgi:hypothetical protein